MKTYRVPSHFTLIEFFIGLALVMMVAGFSGYKLKVLLERRRFVSDVDKLQMALFSSNRMAVNMQASWIATLILTKEGWLFSSKCLEQTSHLPDLKMKPFSVLLNGQLVNELVFEFSGTGWFEPLGVITLTDSKQTVRWDLSTMFGENGIQTDRKKNPVVYQGAH